MGSDREGLLLRDDVLRATGCAMEVLNALGHGLLEKPQENALVVELGLILNSKHPRLKWKRVILERTANQRPS